jgi:hypothetical protein
MEHRIEIWKEKERLRFSLPYKRQLVDAIWEAFEEEDTVQWDPEERMWVVHESAIKKFTSLLVEHLGVNEELLLREIEQPTYDSKVPLILREEEDYEGENEDEEEDLLAEEEEEEE